MPRLAASLTFLLAAAVAAPTRAETTAELFAARCAMCHGADGKGAPAGKAMGVKDLTQVTESEAALARDIANGERNMPAFKGQLTEAQIRALAKYVKRGLKP